jgi:hypothetical protein
MNSCVVSFSFLVLTILHILLATTSQCQKLTNLMQVYIIILILQLVPLLKMVLCNHSVLDEHFISWKVQVVIFWKTRETSKNSESASNWKLHVIWDSSIKSIIYCCLYPQDHIYYPASLVFQVSSSFISSFYHLIRTHYMFFKSMKPCFTCIEN